MKKNDNLLLIICAISVLSLGSLIFIFPNKNFSESENRYLSKPPNFTLTSLLSNTYTKELSDFYTDQFPFRSIATSLYAVSERAIGKNIVGGVIYTSNQLISIPKNEITNKNIPFAASIVDSKYTLFKNKKNELEQYYKTDHHRTTYGAYLLYRNACEKLKITPYPENYFTKEIICNNFYGTDFFKSQLPKSLVSSDTIELWRYPNDNDTVFTIHDNQTISLGFYDFSKLEATDKYAVFLGGNYAHASITSNLNKPTLLLFKDSFANAVIPFLALHFNVEIVDPRYATQSQLANIYNNTSYDYILFIGCLDSFE